MWAGWKAFYDGIRIAGVKYRDKENKLLDMWLEECKTCHFWFPYKGIVLISERPTVLKVNKMGRLDCTDGMAIQYSDGWGVYAINGIRLDEEYFKNPLTTKMIDECSNAEQRRVLITKYGTPKYIQDSGSVKIAEDEWGTLYRKERAGDTPIEMVKVVNSTPEPDGTFKDYWLRVKPGSKTALEAIASTFRVPFKDKCKVFARQGDILTVKVDLFEKTSDYRPLTVDEYKMLEFQT